jgi:glycosyltransferase involved in cell wall biosynthesis
MKIVLVSHLCHPERMTGAEKSLLDAAREARNLGHGVLVWTPGEGLLSSMLRNEGFGVRLMAFPNLWLQARQGLPLPREMWHAIKACLSFHWLWKTRRVLREDEPDAVHVNTVVNVWPAVAAWSLGIPVVWHVREIYPPGWRRRFSEALVKRMAARAVCVSHAAAEALPGMFAGKLFVLHNGISLENSVPCVEKSETRRRSGAGPGDSVLLWAGQWEAHKGLGDFLRISALLVERMQEAGNFKIAVLGAPPKPHPMRKTHRLARRLHLSESIHWAGFQPNPGDWYHAADLLIFTSLRPDPLPRVLLEAMAAGLPAVAYGGGGVPELVEDGVTGILVKTGDVEGAARAVETLLRDEALRRRMGEAARRRAEENFGMERFREGLARVYEGLVS